MDIEDEEPTEVDHVLAQLEAWQDKLTSLTTGGAGGVLATLSDERLLGVWRRHEQIRHRSAVFDHDAIVEAQARQLPQSVCQPGMVEVLVAALRLSHAEAARRVRAAAALGERVSMTGEPLAPLRPALAQAQREGTASPEQVDVCLRAIEQVEHRGFDPADLDAADSLFAGWTATLDPRALRQAADRVVERIDPDGTRPRDEVNADRRHLGLRKTRDGQAWVVDGRLTGAVGAKLQAVLGPLAAPRVESVVVEDGCVVAQPDPRRYGQRMHDALEEVCDRLLRSGTLPASGGTPTTVIITISADSLRTRTGCGTTSDGTRLSAEAVLGLADEADVYLARVDAFGVVLELGRTRRLATCGQTMALIARDGGCSFPGCDRPPEWAERHHVVAWVDGGTTDLSNLTLLCGYHHHHFAGRGWTCRMRDGLPTWTPPRWVDPQQRPQLNARIAARHPVPLRT